MIDFMVVGLPRSGTAWLANWFTTSKSLCLHEPLLKFDLPALDARKDQQFFGISDTCLHLLDIDTLNRHPARKLIVHRRLREINDSLSKLGLPLMKDEHKWRLDEIGGWHIFFDELFDVKCFRPAHKWLVPVEFNQERYDMLCGMNVQNDAVIDQVQRICMEKNDE